MSEFRASSKMFKAGRDSVVTQFQLSKQKNSASPIAEDVTVVSEVTEASYVRPV
jgi:hypothetical protein